MACSLYGRSSALKRLLYNVNRTKFEKSLSTMTPEDGNYTEPSIVTDIPGPKSLELKKKAAKMKRVEQLHMFVDVEKSKGNFIVDIDGNRFLDVYQMIASLPLGFNHEAMIAKSQTPLFQSLVANRTAQGFLPAGNFVDQMENTLLKVAPKGMLAQQMMCGSCSNENAMKSVFTRYNAIKRGSKEPTDLELETCMRGEHPGNPEDLCILSFDKGFHGRTIATLAVSHSKAVHKFDYPGWKWPCAPFPKLKYPLENFVQENHEEEQRCLSELRRIIQESNDNGLFVAGAIVEPIQAEGGDNHASAEFFRGVQAILKEFDAAFIVDEVQTGGGASGKWWMHELWDLPETPDIVTFAKKMQVGGFFFKPEYFANHTIRIFNTWMGDPVRMSLLESFVETAEKDNLLDRTEKAGVVLQQEIKTLEAAFPEIVREARGVGTICAFNCPTPEMRDELVPQFRKVGLQIGPCGDQGVRFRPALIFNDQHAKMTGELLHEGLRHFKEMKGL